MSDAATRLRAHLLRWRGSWIKKLPDDLKSVLAAIEPNDLKKAATILIHGPSLCEEGIERPFKRIGDGWQFCSTSNACPCFKKHFVEKSRGTSLEKFGVENPAQATTVKDKIRNTCMERYGVPTTGELTTRQNKAKKTNLDRYGHENVFGSDEIKRRIRERTLAEHGVDHISKSPDHQSRMRVAVREKYGLDNVGKSPDVRAKIVETNISRYGGNSPASSPDVVRRMRQTTEERYGGHYAHLHILPEHRIKNEADFRQRFAGKKAAEMALITGYDPSMIHRYAELWDVELDYSGGSKRGLEKDFGDWLEAYGIQIRRNVRVLEPNGAVTDGRKRQEVDFVVDDYNLGIEIHGVYWHSTANGRGRNYHADKLRAAESKGLELIQIFEDEWLERPNAVLSAILHRTHRTKDRTFARKCVLVDVSHADAQRFYEANHVLGGTSATLHLGLEQAGKLVAAMSFTRRADRHWEMVRYASRGSVVAGASRLLASFERANEWDVITSFVDLRWSKGALYQTLGFSVEHHYPPDYMYVIGNRRVHKFNLRKSAKRFQKYDGQNLSGRQMAELEGIPRVYDAGKLRVAKYRK